MKRFWKSLKRKLFTDRADSILVPAMILAPVMALTLGMAVEVAKNNYIRTERIDAIQDAASSAVTLADTRGSLNWSVVDRIVNEYEHNRFGQRVFSSTANDRIKYDGKNPDGSTLKETKEGTVFDSFAGPQSCLTGSGSESTQRYPQYKVTLDEGRGINSTSAKTVNFVRTQPSVDQLNQMAKLNVRKADGKMPIYRVVRVEIIDQTPNIVLGLLGAPCQKFTLSANAVTFAADTDLR